MKLHSSNLKIEAGILAIHNLNVFTDSTGNYADKQYQYNDFRACMARSAILKAEVNLSSPPPHAERPGRGVFWKGWESDAGTRRRSATTSPSLSSMMRSACSAMLMSWVTITRV